VLTHRPVQPHEEIDMRKLIALVIAGCFAAGSAGALAQAKKDEMMKDDMKKDKTMKDDKKKKDDMKK
jgi:pentapeptide MXKDX repeat protein